MAIDKLFTQIIYTNNRNRNYFQALAQKRNLDDDRVNEASYNGASEPHTHVVSITRYEYDFTPGGNLKNR